jgi:hypothetical protein
LVNCQPTLLPKRHIPERGRDLAGDQELGRCPKLHGRAAVQIDLELLFPFFMKEPDEQSVEPTDETPIEESKVIAGSVGAVVRKLDPTPFANRKPFAGKCPRASLPGCQFQGFEPTQKLRRE